MSSPAVPRVHRLPSGVRVMADPMAGLQSCALSVVIQGGARWEDAATNGWAHLLEHMVFKGAGGRSARAIVEAIEDEGGWINAATGYERTSFQVRCLKGGLPLAMAVLADLVRRPTLDAADLEQEKGVIGQEIAEAADQPDDRVFDLAQACAYTGQPLGRPILGSTESLAHATVDALSTFHLQLYSPDRIVVAAAGAVDEAELLALAEAAFGDATPQPTPARAPAAFIGGAEAEVRRLEQAHFTLLFDGVASTHPDIYALRLFAEALGGGMSSRLFQLVREEMGLAYAVDAYADSYEDAGVFGVYAGTGAAEAAQAAGLILQQIEALSAAPTAAELQRAKAQMKAQLFMGRETPLARAEQAAAQLHVFGRLKTAEELVAQIEAVCEDDLRRVGRRLLDTGKSAIAMVGPRAARGVLKTLGGGERAAA